MIVEGGAVIGEVLIVNVVVKAWGKAHSGKMPLLR